MRLVGRFALVLLLLGTLAGCGAPLEEQLAPTGAEPLLQPAERVGQTFVARQDGLEGLAAYLAVSGPAGTGRLTLHLRSSALPDAADLRSAELTVSLPLAPGWQRFSFAPLDDAEDRYLYMVIEGQLPAGAALSAGQFPGHTYQDGALYLNHQPQDAQLALRVIYNRGGSIAGLLEWLARSALLLLLGTLLFVLPGLALQSYLLPLEAWQQRLGLAIALSMALYPLLLLWLWLLGLPAGPALAWLPAGAALLALAARWLRPSALATARAALARRREAGWRGVLAHRWLPSTATLVTAAAIALLCASRLLILHHLDSPMWGDSVQHAFISQLMVDHGGLFESWQPYADYTSLTVHYGFHSLVAVFMWASGTPLLEATLIVGQLVNIAAVLALLPLASKASRSHWAGLGVIVAVGLLMPSPHGYMNWGRYPQLSGQTVMPVAAWLCWELFESGGRRRARLAGLASLVIAGMFLHYYRTPYLLGLFILGLALLYGLRPWRAGLRALLSLGAAGLAAGLLLAPWLLHLRDSALGRIASASLSQGAGQPLGAPASAEYRIFYEYNRNIADAYIPDPLLLVAIAVVIWSLLWLRRPGLLLALWTALILLMPAFRLVRIPGSQNLDGFSVLIMLYMPVGLLVGYGADQLLARAPRLPRLGALGLLLALALLGSAQRLQGARQEFRMLAPADLQAFQWIKTHVQPEALFVVESFTIYGNSSIVGSDGGWWLPAIARRRHLTPPQYPQLAEQPTRPGYNAEVLRLVRQLRDQGVTSPQGIDLLCAHNVSHLYIGQGQGRIAAERLTPMLPLDQLQSSPAFRQIYRQDKIGVFELDRSKCAD